MQHSKCCTIRCKPVRLTVEAKLGLKSAHFQNISSPQILKSGTSAPTYNLYISDEGECTAQLQHQPSIHPCTATLSAA
jgi:hypothetical protein